MTNRLSIKLRETTSKGTTGWTGTVSFPGIRPTKVARVKDGETLFPSKSAATSASRGLGKRLGLEVDFEYPQDKKAAKKSVKNKTSPKS